jgi:hypothetical protein
MKSRTERIIAVLQASLREGARVEFAYVDDTSFWRETKFPTWDFLGCKYRVSLLVTGKREPITAKDWEGQAVVWVRLTPTSMTDFMVDQIHDLGYSYAPYSSRREIKWRDYEGNYQASESIPEVWSFDRKTWHPFLREVSGGWQVVASTEEGV